MSFKPGHARFLLVYLGLQGADVLYPEKQNQDNHYTCYEKELFFHSLSTKAKACFEFQDLAIQFPL